MTHRTGLSDTQMRALQADTRSAGVLVVDDRGVLIFTPFKYPTTQARRLGFEWKGKKQHWVAPATRQRIEGLLELWDIAVDSSVHMWMREDRREREQRSRFAAELATQHSVDLYPYQEDAVTFLIGNGQAGSGALLALAPGLGKTVCAIRAAAALGKKRVLVVTLLSMMYQWRREIITWAGAEPDNIQICHRQKPDAQVQWTICNWDTLRLKPPDPGFDLVILDESVLMKNRRAQRTQAAFHTVKSHRGATTVWLLSGAPVTRFMDDLWTQLHIINPRRYSSYWRFARRFCQVDTNHWGTSITGNQPDAETAIKQEAADIFLSCLQDDVLDLPDFLFQEQEVVLGRYQDRVYSEMLDTFMAYLGEHQDLPITAPTVLAQITRLIQLASSPALVGGRSDNAKLNAVMEQLPFLPKPLIIWTIFIDTAQRVYDKVQRAKLSAHLLTGGTPVEQRQEIVDAIQSEACDVVVAHPAVGKFGLTMTKARAGVYLERSFNADDYYQSLFRIRRIGTEHRPLVLNLLAVRAREQGTLPTIDHVVHRVLTHRYNMVQRLTARDLLEEMTRGE